MLRYWLFPLALVTAIVLPVISSQLIKYTLVGKQVETQQTMSVQEDAIARLTELNQTDEPSPSTAPDDCDPVNDPSTCRPG